MAIGGGAITGLHLLPEKWTRPIIDTIIIPAHAQTSEPEVAFGLSCTVGDPPEGATCDRTDQYFNVSGSVSATDSRDMSGVQLDIEFEGEIAPSVMGTDNFTVSVEPGNTFTLTDLAQPPSGQQWSTPNGTITVSFTDQTTYGTASCTQPTTCLIAEVSSLKSFT